MWFDRQGKEISIRKWGRLHRDMAYINVGDSAVIYDSAAWEVSTVWLGMDHGFGFMTGGLPVIFETMIFGINDEYERMANGVCRHDDDEDCNCLEGVQYRYSTEEQARAGHQHAIETIVAQHPDARVIEINRETGKPDQ